MAFDDEEPPTTFVNIEDLKSGMQVGPRAWIVEVDVERRKILVQAGVDRFVWSCVSGLRVAIEDD